MISDNVHAHVNLKMYTGDASQFDWKLSEAYVVSYSDNFDLRKGVQIICWDTTWMINPTNNIDPYDHKD